MVKRTCPRCGVRTSAWDCCGIDLTVRRAPWRMSPELVRRVHILKAQKGMDEETYRLRLGAVGATSCKELSRQAFGTFMAALSALPDRPDCIPAIKRGQNARPRADCGKVGTIKRNTR